MKTQQLRFTSNVMLTAVLIGLIAPQSVAQRQLWLRQFGTFESDGARALAPDGAGGVMVAGRTNGSMGGPYAGLGDVFLAHYDNAGNPLWIRQLGTSEREEAKALAPDGAGGVMVAGYTKGSLVGTNAGVEDAFLARYDAGGNQLWIRQFGTTEPEEALALAPDGAGGVFVGGKTDGDLGGANAGYRDAFLARYDGAGNRLWLRQFGTSSSDEIHALASDGAGGVMVAGFTWGSLSGLNAGYRDAFLARYDGAGNRLWIRQFGTSNQDVAYALASDGAGGVMVAGQTGGNLGVPNAVHAEVFLARYDSAGNRIWIRQFGTEDAELVYALAPDGAGGALVAGLTQGSLGAPNAGGNDAFLVRYDGAGDRLWASQFGTTRSDFATALAFDGAGGTMVAGYTGGSLGGPNAGSFTGDVFLARYEIDSCYADCDPNGVLDVFDFLCFQNSFVQGDPYACDCDTSTGPAVCDMLDFLCFQRAFMAGCP